MDFNTEHEDGEQIEPVVNPVVTQAPRPIFPRQILVIVSAVSLVLAAGSLGFILGHSNQNSTSAVAVAPPQSANPSFPSGSSGAYGSYGNYGNYAGGSNAATPAANAPTSKAQAAAGAIATSVDPGLVDITTQLSYQQSSAAGTGMILTSNGLILTNNHVIDGATSISVRDIATGKTYKATVVGYDVTSDVALLQLANATGLTTVTTNTSGVAVGESVVGIGNAGGVGGTPSYAAGTVLAKDKTITAGDDENPTGSETLSGMIEMNANIQAGDSGGALVNSKGQVVGMDTAALSTNGEPGFNSDSATTTQAFAIPIGTALFIAKSIEKGNSSSTVHVGTTAFLGIEVESAAASPYAGVGGAQPPSTTTNGVTVAGTVAGTPAASSALAAGDVITSVNGQSVTTITSLDKILAMLKPGDSAQVGYTNASGAQTTLDLVLGSGPPQ
jgi:S1-C subfamily serine protease